MKFTSSQSYYSINRAYHSTTGWLNIFNILGYKDSISKLTGHTQSHHSMRILKYVVCQLSHIGIHKLEVKTAPSWSWPTHLHLMPMVKMGEAIPSVGHMPSWRAEWGLWTKTNQPTTHGPKLDRPVLNTIQKRQEYFRSWNPTFRRPLRLVLIRYYFKWIYLQGLKRNWFTKFLSRTYIIDCRERNDTAKILSLSLSSTTLNGGGSFTDVYIQDISCQNLGVVNGSHFRFFPRHCQPFETLQYLEIRVGIRHCRLFRNPYLVTIHYNLSSCSDLQLPTWNRVIK